MAGWRPHPHALLFSYALGIAVAAAVNESADVATQRKRLSRHRGHHLASGASPILYLDRWNSGWASAPYISG